MAEQEVVRVIFRIDPSLIISGISLLLIFTGAGVITFRNLSLDKFRIGPIEVAMKEAQAEAQTEDEIRTAIETNRDSG